MILYPVAIIQNGTQFYAQAPDLPDVTVVGDGLVDTIANMRDAIISHLQTLAHNNEAIIAPQSISDHLNNTKFRGYTWTIISLDPLSFINQASSMAIDVPCYFIRDIRQKIGLDDTADPKEQQQKIEMFIFNAIKAALD